MKLSVGIVGFRGYSGAELIRLLVAHPHLEPVLMEHRSDAGDRAQPLGHSGPKRIAATAEAAREHGLAGVFLATPPEVSMDLAGPLLDASAKVVDLSGAFRLKTADNYRRWYKQEHTAAALFDEAVYGLPEFYRDAVRQARLVSNPGCYPTAANLALAPLIEAGAIDRAAGIVCDAKSGISGAGRKPSLTTSFCETAGNFSAYSILGHRHVPEVLMNSHLDEAEFSFTAQLLPVDRGILETIYFRTLPSADLPAIYRERYAAEPFVRLYSAGQVPDLKSVQRTNFCDIGFHHDTATGRAVVVVAIDNLTKGAAGQAIQNMNLMLGFPETAGLLQ